jgi:thioredoxin domain-containing protein 5
MEQCGHCKRFSPEWDTFVQTYTGPVKLRKVDMSEAGDDLEKYNIRGFPTILIIDENGEYMDYDGPRTSEALTKFLASK